MPRVEGLTISGIGEATCVACERSKECWFIDATDGSIAGYLCRPCMVKVVRLRLGPRMRPINNTSVSDHNGSTSDLASVRE
jgi:hypothetical protein